MESFLQGCTCGCTRIFWNIPLNILTVRYCTQITKIPYMSDIAGLYIFNCPLLKSINNTSGIQILNIENCNSLTEIPNSSWVEQLRIFNCPLITKIPNIQGLKEINVWKCPNLLEIPNIPGLTKYWIVDCPFLNNSKNPVFKKNIKKIKKLQNFIRKNKKYWRFKNWVKSKSFMEWFYHPDNFGGYYHMKNMEKLIG